MHASNSPSHQLWRTVSPTPAHSVWTPQDTVAHSGGMRVVASCGLIDLSGILNGLLGTSASTHLPLGRGDRT